jgi:C4-dicarboxylate transporter, DctM subunit
MIVATLIISLLLFLVFGTPVAVALGLVAVIGLVTTNDTLAVIPQIIYDTLSIYELAAVPLFVLMGQMLLVGGVGERLFGVINRWVCHWPGGLGVATVLTCGFFSAVSGSSTATAATVGTTAIPEMLKRNYSKRLAYGLVAGGGTLGILIPPSIPFVLYSAITSESVGRLYLAGVLPGAVMIVTFILFVMVLSKIGDGLPMTPRVPWGPRLRYTRQHFAALLLPVVVLGGIYVGIFTPTEAAAAGAIYSVALCTFGYRTIGWREIVAVMSATVRISCMLLFIIVSALILARVVTTLQIAPDVISLFEGLGDLSNTWLFLGVMILVWFVMGAFLDVASIMLITLPVAFPVVISLGIDPIWFAVIMVVNMELATITPPIGLNLFVIQGVTGERDIGVILRGAVPIFFLLLFNLALVLAFPALSLWLPFYN